MSLLTVLLPGCGRKTGAPDANRYAKAQNSDPAFREADSVRTMLCEYAKLSDFRSLIRAALPHYEKAKTTDNKHMLMATGAFIAQSYILSDQPDSMFYYLNEIGGIAEEIGYAQPLVIIHNSLGIYYTTSMMDYNEGLKHFLKALEYAAMVDNKWTYYSVLLNLAAIYNLREDPEGLKYALEAYEAEDADGAFPYLSYNRAINTANLYLLAKDYEKAAEYARETELYTASRKDSLSSILLNARIQAATGDHAASERNFREVIESHGQLDITTFSSACRNYGDLLFSQTRYEEAVDVYRRGAEVSEENSHYANLLGLYLGLWNAYRAQEMPQEADTYRQKHETLSHRLFNVDRERSFQEIRFRYENEKREKELKEKELLLAREKNRLNVAIFSIVIILLILTAIYIFYKRKSNMYRRLVMQYESYVRRGRGNPVESEPDSSDSDEGQDSQAEIAADIKCKELFAQLEHLVQTEHIYRDHDISVDKLTELLNTNRWYVSRMFSKYAGTSFNNYINACRINEAVQILSEDSQIPLKVLADDLGFNSMSSFYRLFQKETGVPPSRYRQEVQKLRKAKSL